MKSGKKIMLFVFIAAIIGFTSCSNDDDITPIDDPAKDTSAGSPGYFTLSNTPLLEETVFVENFNMPDDGWIVVRRDDGHDRPMMFEIISIPEMVVAGNYAEYSVALQENLNLEQGERLWVNLHHDNGDHIFSYDGSSNSDMPLGIFDVFKGYTLISNSFIVDLQNQ